MKYKKRESNRRSIRLTGYDYSKPGLYFVTVCTYKKVCLLGEIVNRKMELSEYGSIVETCWLGIPKHFSDVKIENSVIMPNHIHGIITISAWAKHVGSKHAGERSVGARQVGARQVGARHASPLHAQEIRKNSISLKPHSLGSIIGSFKSAATREINQKFNTSFSIWQRGYYDRIIRNEEELFTIKEYIINNPAKWEIDNENPAKNKEIMRIDYL